MKKIILILLCITSLAYAFPKGGIGGAPPYLGPVATAAMLPNTLMGSGSAMTRKAHIARDTIRAVQLAYANWWININPPNNGGEAATGNSIAVKAWIEYPVGTYTAVLFSGGATGTITNSTTTLSDSLTISIPNGATFYTWTHVTGSGGVNFPYYTTTTAGNPLFISGGEAANFGVSPPASPGAISDNLVGRRGYWPAAILGQTSKPTFYIMGDSRTAGVDETTDVTFDLGDVARSIGPSYAYINAGINAQRAAAWFNSSTLQTALSSYASVVIDQLAFNEFDQQSMAVANVQAYKRNLSAHFNGRKYIRTTLEPWSSSTDLWATTSNQTPNAANTPGMNTYNDWVRSPGDSVGYGEISNAVSTAIDSGIWVANGTPKYATPDGIHPNNVGSLLIKTAGGIDPNAIAALPPINTTYASLSLTSGGVISYGTGNFTQALTGGYGYINGVSPGSSPFTEECWVKTSSTSVLYAIASNIGLVVQSGTGNAGIRTANGVFTYSSTPIADNAWHHLAVVYSGGIATLYVDGVSVITYTVNLQNFQIGNITPFVIRAQNSSGALSWAGSVDEVALWNFAKYTTNFTPPVTPYVGNESGLIGVWHLDGNLSGTRGPGGM